MLIRKTTLNQIKQGEVTLAFRRWKKPTVKGGGQLKTAIGVLAIDEVEKVTLKSITTEQAQRAGYPTQAALLSELRQREGDVFKIRLRYFGDDPRIALRQNAELDGEELAGILARLARFDARSKQGPWTESVMSAIAERPHTSAKELAPQLGFEKPWFKANVRKLKEMGLTISQRIGYTLSQRGQRVLKHLQVKSRRQPHAASEE